MTNCTSKLTSLIVLWFMLAILGVAHICALLPQALTGAPFTADIWASDVTGARAMVLDDVGDVLVVAPGAGGIYALWEEANGQVNRTLLVNNSNVNHGIALHENYLYASSHSTVWRWSYTAGQRREASGEETVIQNMDFNASRMFPSVDHVTRTLAFTSQGILYVSVGSASNVDTNSFRSRIRSFNFSSANSIPTGGYDFINDGIVFADGLRNEVGLAFDGKGRLWGVENGADNLFRQDLGGDIHDNNPAEELNLFDGNVDTFYGYPFCWSEYLLPNGTGPGSQWAWPSLENGTITDSWCKNTSNVRPPELAMQAHSAPLGIAFFNGTNCGNVYDNSTNQTLYSVACEYVGDAFITYHGSWDRDVATGYKVVRVGFNETTGLPVSKSASSSVFDVLVNQNLTECYSNATCIRPVDVKFDRRGALLVTSDATGEIIRLTQTTAVAPSPISSPSPSPSPAPSPSPSSSWSIHESARVFTVHRVFVPLVVCILWLSSEDFAHFLP